MLIFLCLCNKKIILTENYYLRNNLKKRFYIIKKSIGKTLFFSTKIFASIKIYKKLTYFFLENNC